MIPENYQPLYQPTDIAQRIRHLAGEISPWIKEVSDRSGKEVVAIPILRGALFFFADLVRAIPLSVEVAPARTWAYDAMADNKPLQSVRIDLFGIQVKGRSVLIVDDICESGRTLAVLRANLMAAGAHEVRSVVTVQREVAGRSFSPDWAAFHYPGKEWLVGYGMDDRDSLRNLPGIYLVPGTGAA